MVVRPSRDELQSGQGNLSVQPANTGEAREPYNQARGQPATASRDHVATLVLVQQRQERGQSVNLGMFLGETLEEV